MYKPPRLSLSNRLPDLVPAQTYAALNHSEARGAAKRRLAADNNQTIRLNLREAAQMLPASPSPISCICRTNTEINK